MTRIEAIRERWSTRRWPTIGYFVHGQAYDDIQALLRWYDQRGEALESIAKNTCCDRCQEAALVARKALKQ